MLKVFSFLCRTSLNRVNIILHFGLTAFTLDQDDTLFSCYFPGCLDFPVVFHIWGSSGLVHFFFGSHKTTQILVPPKFISVVQTPPLSAYIYCCLLGIYTRMTEAKRSLCFPLSHPSPAANSLYSGSGRAIHCVFQSRNSAICGSSYFFTFTFSPSEKSSEICKQYL